MGKFYEATRQSMPILIETMAEVTRLVGDATNVVSGLIFNNFATPEPMLVDPQKRKSKIEPATSGIGNINANFYTNHFKPFILGKDTPEKDKHRKYFRSESVLRWKEEVDSASKKYNIPKNVIFALIHQESGGNRTAKAETSSATGLTQLIKGTARQLGLKVGYDQNGNWVDERLDASKNIDAGAKYLSQQIKRFKGDISLAIMAYHQGGGGASQVLKEAYKGNYENARRKLDVEGLKYVPSVLEYAKYYPGG